jgi:flagellin
VGLSVNTNIAAMNAYRNLSTTNTAMTKSLERLS